jgi:hypothetical protein
MASKSETGHAKNVANFEDLILFCIGYGASYNPSKNSIKIMALNNLLTDARAAIDDVIQKVTIFNIATNNRQDIFKNLRPLSTRIVNALAATDALDKTIDDAKAFNKKIQGSSSKKKQVEEVDSNNPTMPDPKTISTSQQSYDQLKEHFSKLISLLTSEPNYTPNETDLQIGTLNSLLSDMQTANTNVSNSYVEISNSRIIRNKVLYSEGAGLYDTAMEVKKYIKSIFGATSPQYKQISGIKFTKIST